MLGFWALATPPPLVSYLLLLFFLLLLEAQGWFGPDTAWEVATAAAICDLLSYSLCFSIVWKRRLPAAFVLAWAFTSFAAKKGDFC